MNRLGGNLKIFSRAARTGRAGFRIRTRIKILNFQFVLKARALSDRQKRYLERKAKDRGILHPEVDLPGMADMLYAEGYLDDWRCEDRKVLSRVLGEYLADVLRVTGHASDL